MSAAPSFPLDGLRRHKMLTAPDVKALPAIGTTDGQGFDAIALVKLFCPYGRFTFYVTEFDGDDTLYGFTVSQAGADCDEWGYGSLSELANLKLNTGTPAIERDCYWTPAPVGECEVASLARERHERVAA